MLRAAFLVLLLWRCSSSGAELVPESTSPDGRYALAFESPPLVNFEPPPRVWFVRLPGLTHVSAQLTPTDEAIYRKKRINGIETLFLRNQRTGPRALDRQMMFEILVSAVQAQRHGEDLAAANCQVDWSEDSRRVTVWVGLHKFGHASVFRLRHGRFLRYKDYVPD